MRAKLSNYRQSPRKVRLVAKSILGKRADKAMTHLNFVGKRAAGPISKLLSSAIANAKVKGLEASSLVVSKASVDAGYVLKRSMPRARGSAFPIKKRTSHVVIELSPSGK